MTARDEARAALGVGVIGYGLAGSAFHAPLIAATEGLRLHAIVTSDPTRRAKAARDHPEAILVDTADDLLQRAAELSLVVIATPNRTHVPLARAALDAGLAVVVDKPFAPTAAEARALVDHARERGLLLTVYQNRRWDGDFRTVRRLASDGAFGDIMRFESRFERWRPTPKGGWREQADPAEAGGLLYDLGSHLIDQALMLLGPAVSVYAELDRKRQGVESDDDSFVALKHVSGARSHLAMSAVAGQAGPRLRVLGSRAAYLKFGLDVQEDALRRGERPGAPGWGEEPRDRWGSLGAGDDVRLVPTEAGAYQDFYAAVLRALRNGGPPPVDPNDAVAGLDVIAAARRSAETGRVIQLGG
ncbi:MAG: Gfo/Idh/MocA family oxidoreductase [Gemmatimonadaceae bacterium]